MRTVGLAKLTRAIYDLGPRLRDLSSAADTASSANVLDEETWAERLVTVAKRAFEGSMDVAFAILEQNEDGEDVRVASVVNHAERVRAREDRPADVGDVVQIVGHPDPGAVAVLYVVFPRKVTPSQYERQLLSGLGLHLENAIRLRRRPDAVKAVLSDDGRVVEGAVGAAPLWSALVKGRASLVPSSQRGRRRYLLVDAPPGWHTYRRLTDQEVRVVTMAACGHRDRALSQVLDLAPGTVSRALRSAAAKIGVPSSFELIRLASRLAIDAPPPTLPETLTSAERDVLDLLRAGLSNQEIAKRRGRATRTVANQVASLLRKTNSTSRRALAFAVEP